MDLRVSVAVSTYNRRDRLADLIFGLAGQQLDAGSFEVVICDNGSSDGSAEELDRLARLHPGLGLKVIRLNTNNGPSPGRNAAWHATRSEIVAFTDDDCVPQPGWLVKLIDPLERDEADIVQGRTLPRPDQLDRLGPWSRTQRIEAETGHYQTCNIAYRKPALRAVGGFRRDFPVAAGEDTDLALSVKKAGFNRTAFVSEALVFHEVLDGTYLQFLKDRARWTPLIQVIRHHPESRNLAYRRFFYRPSHVRVLVGLGLAGLGWAIRPWLPVAALGGTAAAYVFKTRHRPQPARIRLLRLGQVLVADAYEVLRFAGASLRYRRLLL